jgi:hypothetical protein
MDKKVLTKEELDTLKGFQDQENNIVFSFGQIEYQIAGLETQKDNLIEAKQAFEQKRIEFAKVLTEKYGDGNINLENGEISPTS